MQKNSGSAKYNLNYTQANGSANYAAAGNLLGYQLINYDGSSYTNTYSYNHLRRDAYLEGSVNGSSTVLQGGATTNSYDVNNNLVGVTDSTKAANSRSLVNDVAGRILQSTQNGNVQRQLVVNGEVLGRHGSYLNPDKATDGSGNPNFVTGSSFNFGYTKISGSYPATQPGTRTVAAGETLQSIAKSAYGDGSLWYLIADANGLSGDRDLRVGQTLTVPNRVTGAKNSSSNFKPYNPGEVVGNTTPNLPNPPASSGGGGGCGLLGEIIIVVVTIVVTAYTGSAALGNLAGQVVGNVTGNRNGINWTAVAMAAISQEISQGISNSGVDFTGGAGESYEWVNVAARAAVSNVATQTVAVALGQQKDFSWSSVAMAAASPSINKLVDKVTPNIQSSLGWGEQASKVAQDSLNGFVRGMTINAMQGGRMTEMQVATDAFGNALGNSLGEKLKNSGVQEDRLGQFIDEQVAVQGQRDSAAWDRHVNAAKTGGGAWDDAPLPSMADQYAKTYGGEIRQTGDRLDLSRGRDDDLDQQIKDNKAYLNMLDRKDATRVAAPAAGLTAASDKTARWMPDRPDLGGDPAAYLERAAANKRYADQMLVYSAEAEKSGNTKNAEEYKRMAAGYLNAAGFDQAAASKFETHTRPMWEGVNPPEFKPGPQWSHWGANASGVRAVENSFSIDRRDVAAGAALVGRVSGVVSSTATAAAAVPGPHQPIAAGVAVTSTAVGFAALAVEQIAMPNAGKTSVEVVTSAVSEVLNRKIPLVAPVTNEIVERAKNSQMSQQVQDRLNRR